MSSADAAVVKVKEVLVHELLGEGRCSVVYSGELVRPCCTGRASASSTASTSSTCGPGGNASARVAVKCWREGSRFEGALHRELHVLNHVHHPNIVSLLGMSFDEGPRTWCMILELLTFELRDLVAMKAPLAIAVTQKLASNILSGLEALHTQGIGHGDLKPSNIMWSEGSRCFKMIDFGLAFSQDEQQLHSIQSPLYAAPEAVQWNERRKNGLMNINQSSHSLVRPGLKTDVYALGCVLYECRSGVKFKSGGCQSSLQFNWRKDNSTEHDQLLIDLINRMTSSNTGLRIEASTALSHPFVKLAGLIINEEDLKL